MNEHMKWEKREGGELPLFELAFLLFFSLDKLRCDGNYLALIIGVGGLGIVVVAVDIDLQGNVDFMKASNSAPSTNNNRFESREKTFNVSIRIKSQILHASLIGRKCSISLLRRL